MSKIEWTEKTWNPVRGCAPVSPGCANCYAQSQAGRFSGPGAPYEGLVQLSGNRRGYRWNGTFREVPEMLGEPLGRKKPTTYFVNSMSDLFGEGVSNEFIAAVFGVMAACPQHRFQVLTKRAERLAEWFEWAYNQTCHASYNSSSITRRMILQACDVGTLDYVNDLGIGAVEKWPLANVHIGVSVEDRRHGLPRVDELRKVPAAVRFLSIEPLLEDLGGLDLTGIHWVIVGGESGHHARPMHPEWVRKIRDQCVAARVPFFFKQWGEWAPLCRSALRIGIPDTGGRKHKVVGDYIVLQVGKKAAGRTLDGRTWDEVPD